MMFTSNGLRISSVWEIDGQYTIAIDNRVHDRVPVSTSTAEELLKAAKNHDAIWRELPVRNGGYVWYISGNIALASLLQPLELKGAREKWQGYDSRMALNGSSSGGTGRQSSNGR